MCVCVCCWGLQEADSRSEGLFLCTKEEKCCTNEPVGVTESGRLLFGRDSVELKRFMLSRLLQPLTWSLFFMSLCRKYLSLQMLALQPLSVLVCVTPPRSNEHNYSGMPEGNHFKFGTNIHLHSWTNWLEFGGQRSRHLMQHPKKWNPDFGTNSEIMKCFCAVFFTVPHFTPSLCAVTSLMFQQLSADYKIHAVNTDSRSRRTGELTSLLYLRWSGLLNRTSMLHFTVTSAADSTIDLIM